MNAKDVVNKLIEAAKPQDATVVLEIIKLLDKVLQ